MSYQTLSRVAVVSLFGIMAAPAFGQSPVFTYQGKLESNSQPIDIPIDFRFRIFTSPAAGTMVHEGYVFDVPVTRGLFSADLPLTSNLFDGADYWLEIAVRDGSLDNTNLNPLTFTTLSPRQQIRPAPYALFAKAGSASQIQGRAVSAAVPATGQVLKYNGAQWAPAADSDTTYSAGSGLQLAGTTLSIAAGGVTGTMIAANAVNSNHIVDGTIVPADLALNALGLSRVTAGQMQANTVGTAITIGSAAPFSNPLTIFAPATASGGVGSFAEVIARLRNPSAGAHSALAVDALAGQDAILYLGENGAASWGIRSDSSDAQKLNIRSHIGGANTTHLTITTAGNVGIGTTVPTELLHVAGNILADDPATSGPIDVLVGGSSGGRGIQMSGGSVVTGFGTGEVRFTGGSMQLIANATTPIPVTNGITINTAGNVGIGTTSPAVKLHVVGTIRTDVIELTGGSDLAEPFESSDARPLEPGSVLVIDHARPGQVRLSESEYDSRVAGVVSGAGGVKPGVTMTQAGMMDGKVQVALTGRVYVRCDASASAISAGDLLTTSNVPGHAMKAADRERRCGAVIGKALTSLESGRGLVLVLVNLQ